MAVGPALRPAQAPCACLANTRYVRSVGRQADLSNDLEPPLGGGSGERCIAPQAQGGLRPPCAGCRHQVRSIADQITPSLAIVATISCTNWSISCVTER